MISRITKFAAAAIFVAVIIGLHQFSNSISGTGMVWADVAERLGKVSSYTAQADRVLTEVGQEEPFFQCDVLKYFSPDHGFMEESYAGDELAMVAYPSMSKESLLIVFPRNKVYCRFDYNEEFLALVEDMNPANTDGIMKLFGSERCTRLGSREIDGVIAEGFEVKDVNIFSQVPGFLLQLEDFDVRLWVNEETLLPIRIEGECFFKGLMTGFKDCRYEEVMYNFEYDAEIDERIFEPNIPDDYILIDPADMAQKAELGMLGVVPFGIAIVGYRHYRKRA